MKTIQNFLISILLLSSAAAFASGKCYYRSFNRCGNTHTALGCFWNSPMYEGSFTAPSFQKCKDFTQGRGKYVQIKFTDSVTHQVQRTSVFHQKAVSPTERYEFLTDDQKKTVLDQMSLTCADTACEGDFNFEYKRLECNARQGSCVVQYTIQTQNTLRTQECSFRDIQSIDQLVIGTPLALSAQAHQTLDACLEAAITELHP